MTKNRDEIHYVEQKCLRTESDENGDEYMYIMSKLSDKKGDGAKCLDTQGTRKRATFVTRGEVTRSRPGCYRVTDFFFLCAIDSCRKGGGGVPYLFLFEAPFSLKELGIPSPKKTEF